VSPPPKQKLPSITKDRFPSIVVEHDTYSALEGKPSPPPVKKLVLDMSKMPPRFKDQEALYQSRVERHWEETSRALETLGYVKRRGYDRMLLEELGLSSLVGGDAD
jgi:hypothetical protein